MFVDKNIRYSRDDIHSFLEGRYGFEAGVIFSRFYKYGHKTFVDLLVDLCTINIASPISSVWIHLCVHTFVRTHILLTRK